MGENQLKKELEKLAAYTENISENTELFKYIKQINDMLYSNGEKRVFELEYKSIVEQLDRTNAPFLSVIVRTKGNRPVGLSEALLCLRAQTNQNFEVLLIAHNAMEQGKKVVEQIINEQPELFRKKIRYIELDRGSRTTPINIGFANARGKYIAVFDDDDLLFDNWVESFYEAAKKNDGKILHAYVLAQRWKTFETFNADGESVTNYMAIDAPTNQFCQKFDILSQLVVNKCPLMSLAFPAYLFHDLGIVFNEELDVTEDWEYFMRVVTLTGIADINEATSIYRLWTNAENSATLHNQEEWSATYQRIHESMNNRAFLVPEGYTDVIISLIHKVNTPVGQLFKGIPEMDGLLYYGEDNKFTDDRMMRGIDNGNALNIDLLYSLPMEEGKICNFRYDPCQYGGIILQDLRITMVFADGTEENVDLEKVQHNGMKCDMGIYFLKFDPQVVWSYEGEQMVRVIKITGNVSREIPADVVENAIAYYSKNTTIRNSFKKIF